MPHRLTVVVSQSRSQNPKKRAVEEAIVAELLGKPGIDVTVVPHLYDLKADGSGMLCLTGITGDVVVCSWLYPRAARWILDRNGIRGREGTSLLKSLGESGEEDAEDASEVGDDSQKPRVIDQLNLPSRRIYCLDLRAYDTALPYLDEVQRIAEELSTPTVTLADWISGDPKPEQMERYLLGKKNGTPSGNGSGSASPHAPVSAEETPARRWYPVIDLSRCTNCLECIDFCLFGVYGIDAQETILVEQPDNCRQGCPACSRVCPENAIIFPQHKSPTIAGSAEFGGNMKIDLSLLFGAPDPGEPGAEKAFEVAARERDEQLLKVGREPVGTKASLPKRHGNAVAADSRDELDELMDAVDQFNL